MSTRENHNMGRFRRKIRVQLHARRALVPLSPPTYKISSKYLYQESWNVEVFQCRPGRELGSREMRAPFVFQAPALHENPQFPSLVTSKQLHSRYFPQDNFQKILLVIIFQKEYIRAAVL